MDEVKEYLRKYGCAYSESDDNVNIPRGVIRSLLRKIEELKKVLFGHRWDLHCGSNRPCGTCRESARALGLDVPDQCAAERFDKQFSRQ